MSRPRKNASEKKRTGAGGMLDNGYKAVQLWLTPEEHALVKKAAAADRRPVTQFFIHNALVAAIALTAKIDR